MKNKKFKVGKSYKALEHVYDPQGLHLFIKNKIYKCIKKGYLDNSQYAEWKNKYASKFIEWKPTPLSQKARLLLQRINDTSQVESKTVLKSPVHYDNSKGSIYKFCNDQGLNSWEMDIIKRIVRCRKKGNFKEDLDKTRFLLDLYEREYEGED